MPIYKTGKTKNGKTQYRVFVNYTNRNGESKRLTKCVYGKAEAAAAEMQFLKDAAEANVASKITLRRLYDEYIKAKAHEVRASSLMKTKSAIGNHVLNTSLADQRLDRLTVPALQSWKNDLGSKELTVTTKNNMIKEFSAMLNYAVRMEYLPKNPLKNVGRFNDAYFTTQEDKLQYYTADQFRLYIAAAEESRRNLTDYACYIFFNLAYYTGARKGELNALKWSDLDGDVIHIRRSICQKSKKGYEETPPKNKSSVRDLRVPQKVLSLLEEYKSTLDKSFGWREDMRLCGGIKPISDSNLDNHNRKFAELAGLPHIRIHDFRHSHATLLVNENVNIKEVARRLGHSDVSMTWNTYAHLYPKAEDQALNVLDRV